MINKNETFNYTYSAVQQKEIEDIRKKYISNTVLEETDKMELLRKLDLGVTKKASVISLSVGIVSALIMGFGMSLVMTDMGAAIGMTSVMLPGILIGVLGMAGVISAYPLYQHIIKKERKRIAPQILKLTEELSRQ